MEKQGITIPQIKAIGQSGLVALLKHIDATLSILNVMIEIHGKDTELGAEYARAAATVEHMATTIHKIDQVLTDVIVNDN